jgi:hypothetical protein
MLVTTTNLTGETDAVPIERRRTSQPHLPWTQNENSSDDQYRIVPTHNLGGGKIFQGYESLANWIATQQYVIIDGYSGVLWNDVRNGLSVMLEREGVKVNWIDISTYLKSYQDIQSLVTPSMGSGDSLWG